MNRTYEPTRRAPPGRVERASLQEAWARASEAGQRLLLDRLELAKVEAKDTLSRAGTSAALGAVGGGLALLGYLALMAAAILALSGLIPVPAALAVVGGPHLVVGGALLLAAKVRGGGPRADDDGSVRGPRAGTREGARGVFEHGRA